jgi:hypothetical protein
LVRRFLDSVILLDFLIAATMPRLIVLGTDLVRVLVQFRHKGGNLSKINRTVVPASLARSVSFFLQPWISAKHTLTDEVVVALER